MVGKVKCYRIYNNNNKTKINKLKYIVLDSL